MTQQYLTDRRGIQRFCIVDFVCHLPNRPFSSGNHQVYHLGISINGGIQKWLVYNVHPIYMDDLEVPLFQETTIYKWAVAPDSKLLTRGCHIPFAQQFVSCRRLFQEGNLLFAVGLKLSRRGLRAHVGIIVLVMSTTVHTLNK